MEYILKTNRLTRIAEIDKSIDLSILNERGITQLIHGLDSEFISPYKNDLTLVHLDGYATITEEVEYKLDSDKLYLIISELEDNKKLVSRISDTSIRKIGDSTFVLPHIIRYGNYII